MNRREHDKRHKKNLEEEEEIVEVELNVWLHIGLVCACCTLARISTCASSLLSFKLQIAFQNDSLSLSIFDHSPSLSLVSLENGANPRLHLKIGTKNSIVKSKLNFSSSFKAMWKWEELVSHSQYYSKYAVAHFPNRQSRRSSATPNKSTGK